MVDDALKDRGLLSLAWTQVKSGQAIGWAAARAHLVFIVNHALFAGIGVLQGLGGSIAELTPKPLGVSLVCVPLRVFLMAAHAVCIAVTPLWWGVTSLVNGVRSMINRGANSKALLEKKNIALRRVNMEDYDNPVAAIIGAIGTSLAANQASALVAPSLQQQLVSRGDPAVAAAMPHVLPSNQSPALVAHPCGSWLVREFALIIVAGFKNIQRFSIEFV